MMMTHTKDHEGPTSADPSVLLASDSERQGSAMHQALRQRGMAIEYAGNYAQLTEELRYRKFDVVLLEVTGEHAVEAAVAAALQVKRGHAGQFVGYVADAHLETSGLAGDAVFPRNAARLSEQLRELKTEQR
ncbi:MAG TPA: hypothetical protein VHX37_06235 [Acidobacteriaceae bacterium]|jgi:DNA-binding NtrC family response regulator|nr:hypothetical protein [Acidobacteriaceae bacterium]